MATEVVAPVFDEDVDIMADEIRLVKSKYAFFIDKGDGAYLVYSSLTGAIIAFKEISYIERLQDIMNTDEFIYDENDEILSLFKEKGILIDADTNEDMLVRLMYDENITKSKTLQLILFMTKQCNFRCAYCFQKQEDIKMEMDALQSIIKFVENQVVNNGYKQVKIDFFGGEPLLEYDSIVWFLKTLHETIATYNGVELISDMTTNAYLLSPDKFDTLFSLGCREYMITIDGTEEIHNRMRPLISEEGTWDVILSNIRYMMSTTFDFKIILRSNYNADVVETLPEFYRYISEQFNNDQRIVIFSANIFGHGNDSMLEIYNKSESDRIEAGIAKIIKELGLTSTSPMAMTLPCSRACHASKQNSYTFDCDGLIKKCAVMTDLKQNHIGTLGLNGEFKRNSNVYSKWVCSDYLTERKCKRCKLVPLCFGKKCPLPRVLFGELDCNPSDAEIAIVELLKAYY